MRLDTPFRRFALAPGISGILALVVSLDVAAQEDTSAEVSASATTQTDYTRLVVGPRGGFGRFVETHLDQNTGGASWGVAARYHFTDLSRVQVQVSGSVHERSYVPQGVGEGGSFYPVSNDEWSLDISGAYHHDLWDHPKHNIWAYVGWRHVIFFTDGFDQQLSGAMVGTEFEIRLIQRLIALATVDYTFNLASLTDRPPEEGDSLVGQAISSLRFGGGLRFLVNRLVEIGVAYLGEHLPYDHSDVLIHQAVLEVGFHFRF